MIKFLLKIKILQEVSNEQRHKQGLKRLGKGLFQARRMNPYNPLSYILCVIGIVYAIMFFGIVGFWKELYNPFKWY